MEAILETITLSCLIRKLFLKLSNFILSLFLLFWDFVDISRIFLYLSLEVVFDNDAILFQIEQLTNVLLHFAVLFFKLDDTFKRSHEEIDRVLKGLLKLLMMTNEGEHIFAESSSNTCGQMNSFLHLLGKVNRFIVYNLTKCTHKRVQWVCTIQILSRKITHERNIICRKLLKLWNNLSGFLITNFELVDFKRFPRINLLFRWSSNDCRWPPLFRWSWWLTWS